MTKRPLLLLFAALLLLPTVVEAQLYRWVDEVGVVNYGDRPPPARSRGARTVRDGSANLSVVPGIPKEEMQRLRERDEQRRIAQLERENEELRARDRERALRPSEGVVQEVVVPAFGYPHPPHRPPAVKPAPSKPKPPVKPQPRPEPPLFTAGK